MVKFISQTLPRGTNYSPSWRKQGIEFWSLLDIGEAVIRIAGDRTRITYVDSSNRGNGIKSSTSLRQEFSISGTDLICCESWDTEGIKANRKVISGRQKSLDPRYLRVGTAHLAVYW